MHDYWPMNQAERSTYMQVDYEDTDYPEYQHWIFPGGSFISWRK